MAALRNEGVERFPATRWSLVAEAGEDGAENRREALGRLLVQYLPALRTHLIYGKRLSPDRADDLLQEFTARKILEKNILAQADQRLGKFRTFLLTALDRFLLSQIRAEGAKMRAPDAGAQVADDDWARHASCREDPTGAFDVVWAKSVISEALRQMHVECQNSGRMDLWGVFECRVVAPALEGAEPLDYRHLIERFGFRSPTAAANVLVTAKRMYARILRGVIGQYAQDEQEIDSEIAELRAILMSSK
jgi:hypothetical protein